LRLFTPRNKSVSFTDKYNPKQNKKQTKNKTILACRIHSKELSKSTKIPLSYANTVCVWNNGCFSNAFAFILRFGFLSTAALFHIGVLNRGFKTQLLQKISPLGISLSLTFFQHAKSLIPTSAWFSPQ